MEQDSPEYQVIRENRFYLERQLTPHLSTIAEKLQSKGILTEAQCSTIVSSNSSKQLMNDVILAIQVTPINFYVEFINILQESGNISFTFFIEGTIESARKDIYRESLNTTSGGSGRSYDVFISHEHEEIIVDQIAVSLQQVGLEVFSERTCVRPGDLRTAEVAGALRTCKAFIIVLTKKCVISHSCLGELFQAEALKKPLFPVVLEKDWNKGIAAKPVEKVVQDIACCFVDHPSNFKENLSQLVGIITSKLMSQTETKSAEEDVHIQSPSDALLSEEDFDALLEMLQNTTIKLESTQLTLKEVQQLLLENGYEELATNLRVKLDEAIKEQQQFLKRLDNLMLDSNTKDICYIRVLLVGPPRVGKTTTLNRLLKIFENTSSLDKNKANYQSTLLANCYQVWAMAYVDTDKTVKWMFSKSPGEEKELIDSCLHSMESANLSCSQQNSTLLNINDIGGQPGFLEMLPALSTGPAMYLVLFNLSEKLDIPYEISFDRDGTVILPYDAMHTVESTISQILSAIHSVHSKRKSFPYPKAAMFNERYESFQKVRPKAALIGTHVDKLDNPEKSIRQTADHLEKITTGFDNILLSPEPSTPLLSVNNVSGTDQEQSDIGLIRKFMNKTFRAHFSNAALPIYPKWLTFGTKLREKYKIVKIEACFKLGEEYEMSRKETEFCIWYLDCIGTLMHYANIADDEDNWFKNHVICSPQVIFDSISQLIIASLRVMHSKECTTNRDWADLIKKGQFSMESIEKYCVIDQVSEKLSKEDLLPTKQLIKLLMHSNILSPIIHKDASGTEKIMYFMPAVLDSASLDELTTSPPPDANNPEPLFVTFNCGYVPTGTFCGLITELVTLSSKEILGLKWELVDEAVKRNYVSFYIDHANKVTLLCHDRCFQLRVTRKNPKISLHNLCTHILSAILYILKRLYKNLNPQIAFKCLCSAHAKMKDVKSLCILTESRVSTAFLCGRNPIELESECHQVWFGKSVTLGTSSSVKLEVLKFAGNNFSYHWTKEGFRHQMGTTNVLTINNITKENLGYYRCDVKEAERVVLTVYRALFREESTTSSIEHSQLGETKSGKRPLVSRDSECQPEAKRKGSTLPPGESHSEVCAVSSGQQAELEVSHTSGPRAVADTNESVVLQRLMEKYCISSDQFNTTIDWEDIFFLSHYIHFDNIELYIRVFGLTLVEQANIRRMVHVHDNRRAMIECLSLWRRHNPSTATPKALLEILLSLGEEEIAFEICHYYNFYHSKHKNHSN